MITLKDKNCLVIGLGKSGQAAICLLAQNQAHVFATDQSEKVILSEKVDSLVQAGTVQIEYGKHSKEWTGDIDLVVVSPGVPQESLPLVWAREKKIPVWSEIELASQLQEKPIIAITGSNGKSTTTALIYELLRAQGYSPAIGGNFGTPFSELLCLHPNADLFVLEVSSFQLEGCYSFSPQVSVLTNLSANHLDRYPTYFHYCREKGKLFTTQKKEGRAILRRNDFNLLKSLGTVFKQQTLFVDPQRRNLTSEAYFIEEKLYIRTEQGEENVCLIDEIMLKGKHNLENIFCAISAVLPFGVEIEAIRSVLKRFKGLEHRIEKVKSIDGVPYINDSKATSTDAVKQAFKSFDSICWIAGGRNKGSDFSSLVLDVQKKVRHAFFIGESKEEMAQLFDPFIQVEVVGSLEEAIEGASRKVKDGDVVLFSPGCSSFDMFQSFEHRGDRFKEIVSKL